MREAEKGQANKRSEETGAGGRTKDSDRARLSPIKTLPLIMWLFGR